MLQIIWIMLDILLLAKWTDLFFCNLCPCILAFCLFLLFCELLDCVSVMRSCNTVLSVTRLFVQRWIRANEWRRKSRMKLKSWKRKLLSENVVLLQRKGVSVVGVIWSIIDNYSCGVVTFFFFLWILYSLYLSSFSCFLRKPRVSEFWCPLTAGWLRTVWFVPSLTDTCGSPEPSTAAELGLACQLRACSTLHQRAGTRPTQCHPAAPPPGGGFAWTSLA